MNVVNNILGKKDRRTEMVSYDLYKKSYEKLNTKQKDKVNKSLEIWHMGSD